MIGSRCRDELLHQWQVNAVEPAHAKAHGPGSTPEFGQLADADVISLLEERHRRMAHSGDGPSG